MHRLKPIAGFFGRFALVFALLTAPWPGWPQAYAAALRTGARLLYGQFGSKGIVLFRPHSSLQPLDSMIPI